MVGSGPEGPAFADWTNSILPSSERGLEPAPDVIRGGGRPPVWGSPADATPFGRALFPGLAGHGPGLGQLAFDRAHPPMP